MKALVLRGFVLAIALVGLFLLYVYTYKDALFAKSHEMIL